MAQQEVERFAYGKRYWYPHMMPRDVEIWERFLLAHPDYFDECQYDVPVGGGADFDTVVNDASGGEIGKLYQRKIDVVAWKGSQPYIIEVKPRASTSAIGQVRGYRALYKIDYKPENEPICVLVTDAELPDMAMLTAADDVRLFVV